MTSPTLCIPEGTPGQVRKAGGEWRPHNATKDHRFATAIRHDGGYLVFVLGDWQFKVLGRLVLGGHQRPVTVGHDYPKSGTFNRCILGPNGRGVSRRRALKRRRKWAAARREMV
jgi:hypothetical protein